MSFVNLRTRDVTFEFQDSCQCCLGLPFRRNNQVAVTQEGQVVRASSHFHREQSLRIKESIANIISRLDAVSRQYSLQEHILRQQVENDLGKGLQDLNILTLEHIERINNVLQLFIEGMNHGTPPTS